MNINVKTQTETTTAITPAITQGLDAEQLGHVRRIEAISRLLASDWSGMHGKAHRQGDDFGGYCFQLSYAAYALALAHRNRLPNAPGVFKDTFARLIEKMLLPEVWLYWKDMSNGGGLYNFHLGDLGEEWDPVVRDNIMYSAYVQSMATMFNVLFDDDRYTKPGSLTFEYFALGWGGGPKSFAYDQNKLTDVIYWQMVKNGYLGVACEPNACFIACNQPAIIGFRMHDILTGGTLAEDAVAGFKQAWADAANGFLDEDGHYLALIQEDSKAVVDNKLRQPTGDAWPGALMNTWHRDFVHEHYKHQMAHHLIPGTDGTMSVRAPRYNAGDLNGDHLPQGFALIEGPMDFDQGEFGWAAMFASEMGDTDTLDGLLAHADRYMNPTWADGALYYPRNDQETDAEGHYTLMEPITSNALLPYARLNVQDGMWTLYNEPWDRTHFAEPLVVELTDAVNLTTAYFDRDTRQLSITAAQRPGHTGPATFDITNLGTDFTVAIDGQPADPALIRRDGDLVRVSCPAGERVDFVFTVPGWES